MMRAHAAGEEVGGCLLRKATREGGRLRVETVDAF